MPRLKASSGARRLQFLYDSLRELRDSLDGRQLLTRGRPEARIPALAKEIDATSVHVSSDFSPFGRRVTMRCVRRSVTCRYSRPDRRSWSHRDG
jgi:deoxyribodipyrimidine photolyase